MGNFVVSGSSHLHAEMNVKKIMWNVVLALVPAFFISIYFFGINALIIVAVSIAACLLFEWAIQKYLIKGPTTVNDGSAVITGLLLAFNVPSNLPIWILLIGAFVAIGVGKMSFGGLGKNIFNPALVGRAFLLISFPVQMTTWPKPIPLFAEGITDALSGPTPLGILKEGLKQGATVDQLIGKIPTDLALLIGDKGGSLGEISGIAIIIGVVYLLIRRIITWHIPVSFIGSALIFSTILWISNPAYFVEPIFYILSGGLLLGACFMATDMVTSPMSRSGMLIFGCGCGVLSILIRVFGAYPEGVSFAILIMNAFVPLINKAFKERKFGY